MRVKEICLLEKVDGENWEGDTIFLDLPSMPSFVGCLHGYPASVK